MTKHTSELEELAERLERLSRQATARPWVAFDESGIQAIMKGKRPAEKENGYLSRRWPEIVAWPGFDASDVPKRYRPANLYLIVELVNNLPAIVRALRNQGDTNA